MRFQNGFGAVSTRLVESRSRVEERPRASACSQALTDQPIHFPSAFTPNSTPVEAPYHQQDPNNNTVEEEEEAGRRRGGGGQEEDGEEGEGRGRSQVQMNQDTELFEESPTIHFEKGRRIARFSARES